MAATTAEAAASAAARASRAPTVPRAVRRGWRDSGTKGAGEGSEEPTKLPRREGGARVMMVLAVFRGERAEGFKSVGASGSANASFVLTALVKGEFSIGVLRGLC